MLPWCHAPSVLAHPLLDGRTALLSRDLATTTRSVAEFDFRDAVAWQALVSRWEELAPWLVQTLLTPFPPVRAGAGLARRLGVHFHGADPLLLFGQMTTADPTRSPAGTESAWAYTHVMGRDIAFRSDLEAANANLVDGCIDGGTSDRLALAATRALAGPR